MKLIYDALIEGIPDDMPVDDMITTHYGVIVKSRGQVGLSEFRDEYDTRPQLVTKDLLDMSLREMAALIKSWNISEAAIGHAAMNAYYNSPELAAANGLKLTDSLHSEDRNADPFITYQKAVRCKKVVVVGHFPYLEQLFQQRSRLGVEQIVVFAVLIVLPRGGVGVLAAQIDLAGRHPVTHHLTDVA